MPIEIFSSQTIVAEQAARTQRRRALRSAFDGINQLIINTGKYPKVEAAIKIVQSLVAPKISFANGNVLQIPSTKDEPASVDAVQVSKYKAEVARYEYMEERFPELIFLLNQLNISLQREVPDYLIEELLKGIIFLGADINAFIADGQSGEMQQNHKLDRRTNIVTEEIYTNLKKKLYRDYVNPVNGKIRAIWQIATVTINGKMHHFSDWIEVIAKPIDAELLEKYFDQAVADGKILTSNTHLALFEMLCESGQIQTIARVSNEMLEKGLNFEQMRQSPKIEEIMAIQKSINTNAPVYVE